MRKCHVTTKVSKEFLLFGDRLNAGGGSEAAVTVKTFRERVEFALWEEAF